MIEIRTGPMEPFDGNLFAVCLAGATLAGLAVYHSVAGYFHYRYYVRRCHEPETWKCQPGRFLTARMHRKAIRVGTANLTLAGMITGICVYGVASGALKTPIYTDVAEYGWAYTLGMTAVLFVLVDCINYWVHRAMHVKFLFKHIHHRHHRYGATTPYVATAMHPAELLVQQLASFVPLFFIPVHAASAAGVLLYILAYNVVDHSGVRLVSVLPWQPPSRYHDDHHAHFHVNYGQHLMIWDRLFGTLRRQHRRYGEDVFGGRGVREAAVGGQRATADPFVKY